ncbi:chromosome segregation protein SMC [Cardiobacteriaceae bacterium TAE3-ERU3]|nr:chromosome segregation protein SMC [Cardiobacteriaceae bacterium TAE3-ERU3]
MRLTAIHLSGFKSFADKTVFPVDAPLTGILGPNGCGKSNIIDAVRWVLGESAAKQLRGQAMSDVIFAGCASRRAGRQASVELHFDNSEGKAGGAFADYAELVIRREVEHDGQSRYLINKKRCRRKDIVELLQGSGVGARSYAVIEQGMISRVIDAKPEDLRSFIEEAAGIAVYQNRRKDSERRMAQVNEHLSRHDDRLYDLEQQRERLAAEADNAKRHRELQRSLSDVRHRLDSWRLHRTGLTHREQQQAYEAAQAALTERMATVSRNEATLDSLREQAQTAERAVSKARALHHEAREALRSSEREHERLAQHRQHAKQQLEQQEKRLEQISRQQADDKRQLSETQQQLTEQTQQLDALNTTIPELENKRDTDNRYYDSLRLEAERQQSAVAQARARHEETCKRYRQIEARLDDHRQRLAELDNADVDDDLALLHEEAIMALETQQITLENAQLAAEENEEAIAACEAQLTAAQNEREAAQYAWQQAYSRAETLREWQQQQQSADTDLPGFRRLLDEIKVDAAWQPALEGYLNIRLQAWHDDGADRGTGLQYHHAVVECGDVPPAWLGIIQSSAALKDWLGNIEPLAQHDCDIDLTALDAAQQYLTLDGTLISAHTTTPATQHDGQGALARAAALNELNERLPNLEQALQESEAQVNRTQAELQQMRQAQQQSRATLKIQEQALAQAQREVALLAAKSEHQAALHAERQQTRAGWLREISALEQDLAATTAALQQEAHSEQHPEISHEALMQAQHCADSSRKAYQQAFQQQQALQQSLASLRAQERVYIDREQRNLREQEALQAERISAEEVLNESETNIALLDDTRIVQQETLDEVRIALEDAEMQAREHSEAWRNSEKAINEGKHRIELEQARIDQLIERLERSEETLRSLTQQFLESDRKPIVFDISSTLDEASLESEVRRYSRELEALGAVNQTAVEAFAEVGEQYQTLKQQCEDLRDSLEMLSTAIAELDEETRGRLSETMAVVNHHFANLFPRLFRGGEAALTWTGDDVLEAGITISVRPPGKNVKNLSVLSGGEKALTAIALVFALFRLNPAPFCLLDEVDAPLDDGNVNRLTAMLRDMADNTQFIIITHHKNTMQACDHLIGVTMSEPGISRLVAVQMND